MASTSKKVWYVVIDGKANGPFAEEEVKQKLDEKTITYTDLVFRHGFARWVPVAECAEFERRGDDFGTRTVDQLNLPTDESEAGWTVLVKQTTKDGHNHYIQSGPLTAQVIREKLAKGELKYNDHGWKSGFDSWVALGDIGDFDRRRPRNFETAPKPGLAADQKKEEEAAKNGDSPNEPERIEKKKTELPDDLPAPPKGSESSVNFASPESESGVFTLEDPSQSSLVMEEGEEDSASLSSAQLPEIPPQDKTQITAPTLTPKSAKKEEGGDEEKSISTIKPIDDFTGESMLEIETPVPTPAKKVVAPKPKKSPSNPKRPMPKAKSRIAIGFSGVVMGAIVVWAGLQAYHQYRNSGSAGGQVAVSAPPAIPPTAIAPKVLRVVGLKLNSAQPQLAFETDLPAQTQLNVVLTAKPGDILKYPHLTLQRRVTITEGMLPTLDLAGDRLPAGSYRVSVTGGGLSKTVPINVGVHDQSFKTRLAAFKKKIAKQRKNEIALLSKTSKNMSRDFAAISDSYRKFRKLRSKRSKRKWRKIFKKWRKASRRQTAILRKITPGNKHSYYYPDMFFQLKDIDRKLQKGADQLNQSFKTGRRVASKSRSLENVRISLKDFRKNLKTLK